MEPLLRRTRLVDTTGADNPFRRLQGISNYHVTDPGKEEATCATSSDEMKPPAPPLRVYGQLITLITYLPSSMCYHYPSHSFHSLSNGLFTLEKNMTKVTRPVMGLV
ncbi:hypothetical protein E3N88_24557 [Mikania micrantha]|uniref:Uncharacterized protein n=1 Tax=Mikania micrantha TaxID=192012 RepID=A0A5N6N271_9ASTR|nr:hypothetical protein E3N88_24557 [Mikania micrantha]